MARILYISHDIAEPRGGIGVLYEHVAALRTYGFDAYIVHGTHNFRYPFGRMEVPILDASAGFRILDSDILVVPEDHMRAIRACRNLDCHKVLFCQNHFYFFSGLNPGETWADFGFSDYLCVSEPIQQAMKKWFGVTATIIRPFIDDCYFRERLRSVTTKVTVACMPRKGANHLRLVRGLLGAKRLGSTPLVSWIEIDKLTRDQVAIRLRESDVYLSTSSREGLGLPPLEAMASGCLVVGFTGNGGLDYARPANGFWVHDEDPWTLADSLLEVIEGLKRPEGSSLFDAIRLEGQKTALAYSRKQFEHDLTKFWSTRRR